MNAIVEHSARSVAQGKRENQQARTRVRIVLDTNMVLSALVWRGKLWIGWCTTRQFWR